MKNFSSLTRQPGNPPSSRRGLVGGFSLAILLLAGAAHSQTAATLTDIINAPTPGPFDISQLSNAGNAQNPGGLNYYDDNFIPNGPPGQTFITGTNTSGYALSTLAIKTAGLGSWSGINTAQPYSLYVYSVSGTTATLLTTYVSGNFTFNDGDWLQWSGLTNLLAANTIYAYAFYRNTSGYEAMSVASGNPYAGGQIALIPAAGGTISTGNAGTTFDATFNAGVNPPGVPAVVSVSLSPNSNPVYAGTPVTLGIAATGAAPLYYIWQTDNGSGGAAFSNISGAITSTSYGVGTGSLSPGTYEYRVIVSNSVYAVTSGVVSLTLATASAPFLAMDTAIQPAVIYQPAAAYVGTAAQLSAAFNGTQPIYYQWYFTDTNADPAVAVAGGTNTTLNLTNVQFSQSGNYYLTASNAVGGSTTVSSSPAPLTILATPNPFCINFAFWSPGASSDGLYAGPGAVGSGTYWNQLTGDQYNQTNQTSLADNQGANLAMVMKVTTSNWNHTSSGGVPLLESWMITYNVPQPFTFINVPNGVYNLVLYGVDGAYANQTELFTVNNTSLSATNHTYTSLVQGDNYVVFTNLVAVGGTINGTYQSDPPGGEGDFNGAQLQLVSTTVAAPRPYITKIVLSGTSLILSGTNGVNGETSVLLTSANITVPLNQWTPVATNKLNGATFSITNTVNTSAAKSFYIMRVQ